jgi:hypothetical protein
MANPATLTRWFGCDVATDSTNRNGKCWTFSGTATRTATTYASGGKHPHRKRDVFSGSVGATWSRSLIDCVGTLPFSSFGWASIFLPATYFPDGTGQLVIEDNNRNPILTLDITGGNLKQGSTILAPWTTTQRYALAVHFGQTGSLCGSLYDLTGLQNAQRAWSFSLGSWSPSSIAAINVAGVLGASNQECDGAGVARWLTIAGVDSLSHVAAASVSPNLATVENIAEALAPPYDAALIPDGAYPNRKWMVAGRERRTIMIVSGRAGATLAAFKQHVWDHLDLARGLEIDLMDGPSVNEFVGIFDVTTQSSVLAGLKSNTEAILDEANARDSRVRLSTIVTRPNGGSPTNWSTLQTDSMTLHAAQNRASSRAKQSTRGHILFSDPAAAIANHASLFVAGTDDVHPTASGVGEIAKQMILTDTTPPPAAAGQTSGRSNGQCAVTTPAVVIGETVGRSNGQCAAPAPANLIGETAGRSSGQAAVALPAGVPLAGETVGRSSGQLEVTAVGRVAGETSGRAVGEALITALGRIIGETTGRSTLQALITAPTAGPGMVTGQAFGRSSGQAAVTIPGQGPTAPLKGLRLNASVGRRSLTGHVGNRSLKAYA